MQNAIEPQYWEKAMDYATYRQLIRDLLSEGKTTGSNHAENMINYTQLNEQRMKKWDKVAKLSDTLLKQLEQIQTKQYWLVLTEAWCGDAAQNIPVLNKMAETNPHIEIRFLLRDENLELMDQYLTNGGRSIPKMILLDAGSFKELGAWGPRPEAAMGLFRAYKADDNMSYDEFAQQMHTWYAKDKHNSLMSEFGELLEHLQT